MVVRHAGQFIYLVVFRVVRYLHDLLGGLVDAPGRSGVAQNGVTWPNGARVPGLRFGPNASTWSARGR